MPAPKKKMTGLASRRQGTQQTLFGEQVNPDDLLSQGMRSLHDTDRFRTKYIPLDEITDNTTNRFKVSDTSFLEASIEKIGQLQPLVVIQRKDESGSIVFEIKAGSRRFKALKAIRERAERAGDAESEKKFSVAFCIVLPDGASQKEIDAVITETNTTSRNISLSEIFLNFDLIFDLDETGSYKYLPKGKNKYNSASALLKSMGYTFSPSSVKQYLSIYTAHNQEIRRCLESGLLTKRQALAISRMNPMTQDDIMGRIGSYSEDELNAAIAERQAEKKEGRKRNAMRGADTISAIGRMKKQAEKVAAAGAIEFSDELQKSRALEAIDELARCLDEIRKTIG